MNLTKKINIICNRCSKVVCEIRGSEEFPYDFKGIRTIEKHWSAEGGRPVEGWFAEILCVECAADQKKIADLMKNDNDNIVTFARGDNGAEAGKALKAIICSMEKEDKK